MANPEFHYQPMFDLGPDKTEYYLLTTLQIYVSDAIAFPLVDLELHW